MAWIPGGLRHRVSGPFLIQRNVLRPGTRLSGSGPVESAARQQCQDRFQVCVQGNSKALAVKRSDDRSQSRLLSRSLPADENRSDTYVHSLTHLLPKVFGFGCCIRHQAFLVDRQNLTITHQPFAACHGITHHGPIHPKMQMRI